MAKKRTEVTLQEEIETQEQWDNVLQREGLLVIDIYQEWCGPCKAAVGIFKRMKSELNDDLLNFAVAKADAIESLERYRGKCEPCFLFFGSGHLVAAVRGINPPEIIRNITEKLKLEHEVLRGEAERIEIKDPVLLAQELAEAEERRRREEEEEILQETTIVILKPDVVKSGKAEEIISELRSNGIEVLQSMTYQFTKEDTEKFYARLKDEPYFNKLVEFMTSGPSEVLVCVKGAEGIIEEVKSLVGPALYDGKEGLQGLRARYATDTLRNAIHAADGKEEAARELAFFYPDYNPQIVRVRRRKEVVHLTPSSSESDQQIPKDQLPDAFHPEMERTVALLRPQAYAIHKDAIMERIKEAGFVIAAQKEVKLSKEQAEEYYSEHRDEPYFGEITTVMSSGPILALLLTRQDAVETWRKLLGPADIVQAKSTDPGSLRAQFAPDMPLDEETEAQPVNLIHGSATVDEVDRDIQFFFPVERTVAAIKPDAYENRDEIVERIKAAGFQVSASRDLQLTTEMAQELYRNVKDKPFYEDLIKHMTSGPTLFMVVTRQDAVSGWRKLMGPTDPDKAANEVQESTEAKGMSIRATYGRNMLQNAVHGSSSEEHALSTIKLIFGDPETGLPDVEAAVKSESPRDSERGEADVEAAVKSESPRDSERGEAEAVLKEAPTIRSKISEESALSRAASGSVTGSKNPEKVDEDNQDTGRRTSGIAAAQLTPADPLDHQRQPSESGSRKNSRLSVGRNSNATLGYRIGRAPLLIKIKTRQTETQKAWHRFLTNARKPGVGASCVSSHTNSLPRAEVYECNRNSSDSSLKHYIVF